MVVHKVIITKLISCIIATNEAFPIPKTKLYRVYPKLLIASGIDRIKKIKIASGNRNQNIIRRDINIF